MPISRPFGVEATHVAGTDRLLLVATDGRGTETHDAVEISGGDLGSPTPLTQVTQIVSFVGSIGARASLWVLVNPPLGSYNVVMTPSAITRAIVGWEIWVGAHQTTPLGVVATAGNGDGATVQGWR